MSRTSKVTPEAIAAAAAEIERAGNRLTVRAVQGVCGGSTDVVTEGLKAFRDLRESARATLLDTGIFEAFDALCGVVHGHEKKVLAEADRKIEEGLRQIEPALVERDQAMTAAREAEALTLTFQTELNHLRAELQQRDTLVAQSRTAQVLATDQARVAGEQLVRHQVGYENVKEQLAEKKREVKDMRRRIEEAVYQQRSALAKTLLLEKELAAKENELRIARNGGLEMTTTIGATDRSAAPSGASGAPNRESDTSEVQVREMAALRAQVEKLTEKNKALADELQMAGDLIEAQAEKLSDAAGQPVDIDVST